MGMKSSLVLGILGLIPFFVIAISCFIVPPEQDVYNLLIFIFLSYAAIISSFLGGIQWGLITAASDKLYHIFFPLLISTLPALVAWASLLLLGTSLKISLILVISSFICSSIHDYFLYTSKVTPYWFLNIRVPLTIAVILLSGIMYIFIS